MKLKIAGAAAKAAPSAVTSLFPEAEPEPATLDLIERVAAELSAPASGTIAAPGNGERRPRMRVTGNSQVPIVERSKSMCEKLETMSTACAQLADEIRTWPGEDGELLIDILERAEDRPPYWRATLEDLRYTKGKLTPAAVIKDTSDEFGAIVAQFDELRWLFERHLARLQA